MEHYLSLLQQSIKSNWDKTAVCDFEGEAFTFGQFAASIEKFHIIFEGIGITKGDRIVICAKNSARWAISFFATTTYEAVAVPILAEFTPESIENLVNHSQGIILFTDPDIWKKLDPSRMPGLKAVIGVTNFSLLFTSEDKFREAYENLENSFIKKYPMGYSRENVCLPTDSDPKALAIINYTSGTTSAPKGVMLRTECFNEMIEFSMNGIPIMKGDQIVSMLPMGHIYGLVIELMYPLCNGVTIHYLGKTPSPTLLLKAMQAVRPFIVVTVPLVMEKIYKTAVKPILSKLPFRILTSIPIINTFIFRMIRKKLLEAFGGKVRSIIMGGAALNPEVDKAFKKIGLPYTVGYGMTEAAPLLAYEDWKHYVPGSCGKAVSCTEIRIDSEDPLRIVGEIQAKGPNICSGYFNNPEADKLTFTDDGFFHTQDLGIMDAHGNIFIKGRSKNMILSANGQNIYPEEIEAELNRQPFVVESVVVDRSSRLVALVYLDQDAIRREKIDEEDISDIPEKIRTNVNRKLPAYSLISKVEVVQTPFEKTPKMSIKRFLYK